MARKTGSHSEITGPRVRAAAQSLIARHGYAAVSMRQIAREVGVQAGALYLYTSDKQSLLFDLMRVHMEELLDAVAEVDLDGNPAEALDRFARFHITFHLDRAEAVFISYMELRNLTPENFAHIAQQRGSYEALLEGILKRGHRSGQFALPDTKLATMALIAMLTGLTTWFRDGGRLDRKEVERIYLALVHQTVTSGEIPSDIAAVRAVS
ncbi:TetR/AcrR family transcriptional regulator [Dinoroseobacter sp. PD6]|uniref:TetR/AcrR family transcriptional regulator n=1 Tax=Dinoroseobacter sp. PD6 TaxID=3028384 RepID=UPI00237AC611|nr:TetR/AcrR family transcriptional regulator [Dinoroseobacter sp. PD6]MDD9716479.1 TetR/AcrR family transcriptional regulator [Dinoroseobacter sp. PD6]